MGGANFIDVALACKDANSKPVEDVREAFKNVLAEFVR